MVAHSTYTAGSLRSFHHPGGFGASQGMHVGVKEQDGL